MHRKCINLMDKLNFCIGQCNAIYENCQDEIIKPIALKDIRPKKHTDDLTAATYVDVLTHLKSIATTESNIKQENENIQKLKEGLKNKQQSCQKNIFIYDELPDNNTINIEKYSLEQLPDREDIACKIAQKLWCKQCNNSIQTHGAQFNGKINNLSSMCEL